MGKKLDLTGKRFGRWTAISETPLRSNNGNVKWLCRCDCGAEKLESTSVLMRGESRSCGCYNREVITKVNPNYKKKLYSIYGSIKDRIRNSKNKAFHNYGARGIRLCEEWKTYEAFEKWALANGYKDGLWIDRINNDGDYSPENCRWATPKEQQNNKRTNTMLTAKGKTQSVMMWAEETGIKAATLYRRIKLGWAQEDLFKPVNEKYSHPEEIKTALLKAREITRIKEEEE